MSTMQNDTPAVRALGDIRPFRFVAFDATGTDNGVVEADAGDLMVIGITTGDNRSFDSANHSENGDVCALQAGGIKRVELNFTCDAGDRLNPDANGLAVLGSVGEASFAIALEDGSAADVIRCLWDPQIIA